MIPSNLSVSAPTEGTFSSKICTTFSGEIVKESLRHHLSNPKNKITDDAVELMTELMKTLVIEAAVRASKQASLQNRGTVTLEHIESILPQLMLDFS